MLFPIFLMKAKKYDPVRHKDINGWIVEEKYDGVRLQIVVNGLDNIRIYSRNITKETGTFNDYTDKLPQIVTRLRVILSDVPESYHTQIYDGEALALRQGSREKNFTYVTGTLNSDDAVARQEKNEMIHVVLFNIPTMDAPYKEVLNSILVIFSSDDPVIRSPCIALNIDNEAAAIFETIVTAGGEGIILYNPEGRYKFGKKSCSVSNDVLKIKDRYEREVTVIDMVEGTGKDTGTCGALICQDVNGKVFKLGTGFTEGPVSERGSRDWMWAHKSNVPFIIEMYFHSETPDSYRLPVFKRDRYYDKNPNEINGE